MLRPPRYAERQHRKHQKAPGEQRHQRQHGQVYAVGARQIADAFHRIAGRAQRGTGRPVVGARDVAHKLCAVHPRAQPHIHTAQVAATKQALHGGNVHYRQRRTTRLHSACHLQGVQAQAVLQLYCGAGQGLAGQRVEKHRVGCEDGQAVGARRGQGQQVRRHGGHLQGIHPHHTQQGFLARVDGVSAEFQYRCGHRHIGVVQQPAPQRRIHAAGAASCSAQFQVGLAANRTHGL